jgi:hypothetical protein
MATKKPEHRQKTSRLLAEELVSLGSGESDANRLSRKIGLARSVIYELTRRRNIGSIAHPTSYLRKLVELALEGELNPSVRGSAERLDPLTSKQFDEVLEKLRGDRGDDGDDERHDWHDDPDELPPTSHRQRRTESKIADYLERAIKAKREQRKTK